MHFFFNTVSVANAGVPGKGPWKVYAGPDPFTQYKVSDRPPGADQMCILVANAGPLDRAGHRELRGPAVLTVT